MVKFYLTIPVDFVKLKVGRGLKMSGFYDDDTYQYEESYDTAFDINEDVRCWSNSRFAYRHDEQEFGELQYRKDFAARDSHLIGRHARSDADEMYG